MFSIVRKILSDIEVNSIISHKIQQSGFVLGLFYISVPILRKNLKTYKKIQKQFCFGVWLRLHISLLFAYRM